MKRGYKKNLLSKEIQQKIKLLKEIHKNKSL